MKFFTEFVTNTVSWFMQLSKKAKIITVAVSVVVAVLAGLLVWWLGAKIGGAIVGLFTTAGAGLSNSKLKKMQADSDQTQDKIQDIRKQARTENENSRKKEQQQLTNIDNQAQQKNEKADTAAVNGDDQDLINQALQNADEINGTKKGPGVVSLLLPFLPLLFGFFGLVGCQLAGAAGAATPKTANTTGIQYIKIPRSQFLKIVKSQTTCLKNLKKAGVMCEGKLTRQKRTLQAEIDSCHESKKLKSRQLIQCEEKKTPKVPKNLFGWVPWTVAGAGLALGALFFALWRVEVGKQPNTGS